MTVVSSFGSPDRDCVDPLRSARQTSWAAERRRWLRIGFSPRPFRASLEHVAPFASCGRWR